MEGHPLNNLSSQPTKIPGGEAVAERINFSYDLDAGLLIIKITLPQFREQDIEVNYDDEGLEIQALRTVEPDEEPTIRQAYHRRLPLRNGIEFVPESIETDFTAGSLVLEFPVRHCLDPTTALYDPAELDDVDLPTEVEVTIPADESSFDEIEHTFDLTWLETRLLLVAFNTYVHTTAKAEDYDFDIDMTYTISNILGWMVLAEYEEIIDHD